MENEPDMVGRGYQVYVNGVEIRKVVRYDIDEGYVDALCTGGCWGPGTQGRIHLDPKNPNSPCTVRYQGMVEVFVS